MPFFTERDDLVRVLVAGQHVRVRHARHRQVRERFAAGVAGHRHLHQPRVQRVLDVAAQHAVLDQHRVLRRVAFVVDVQRSAPVGERAVVDDGHALRRHALADLARERARSLAVEVALEPVADRLVQQDAGPAGPEHDRHDPRRGRLRNEVHQRLVDRLVRVVGQQRVVEVGEVVASAAARAKSSGLA